MFIWAQTCWSCPWHVHSFLTSQHIWLMPNQIIWINPSHTRNMLTYFSVGRNLWHKNYGEEMRPSETSKASQRGGCHCVYLLQHRGCGLCTFLIILVTPRPGLKCICVFDLNGSNETHFHKQKPEQFPSRKSSALSTPQLSSLSLLSEPFGRGLQ